MRIAKYPTKIALPFSESNDLLQAGVGGGGVHIDPVHWRELLECLFGSRLLRTSLCACYNNVVVPFGQFADLPLHVSMVPDPKPPKNLFQDGVAGLLKTLGKDVANDSNMAILVGKEFEISVIFQPVGIDKRSVKVKDN